MASRLAEKRKWCGRGMEVDVTFGFLVGFVFGRDGVGWS